VPKKYSKGNRSLSHVLDQIIKERLDLSGHDTRFLRRELVTCCKERRLNYRSPDFDRFVTTALDVWTEGGGPHMFSLRLDSRLGSLEPCATG